MVADAGWFIGLGAMRSEALAKCILASDNQACPRVRRVPSDVLWRSAESRCGPHCVVFAHGQWAREVTIGHQSAPVAHSDRSHGAINNAIRTDDHIGAKRHVAFDDSRWVDRSGKFWHVDIVSSAVTMASFPGNLEFRDLGCMSYSQALTLQRSIQQDVIASREGGGHPGVVLLVEHTPPVITISRRAAAESHLLATPEVLEAAGIEVHDTDRGGDITYHGPGQLVVYPILDLNTLELRLHGYMRWLEERAIETLEQFGIKAERDDEATGVWIGTNKICAIGVRVSRWVSMHGLALNVEPDLSHFDCIVPCGLHGRGVTSMRAKLGDECPGMDAVKRAMCNAFANAI